MLKNEIDYIYLLFSMTVNMLDLFSVICCFDFKKRTFISLEVIVLRFMPDWIKNKPCVCVHDCGRGGVALGVYNSLKLPTSKSSLSA